MAEPQTYKRNPNGIRLDIQGGMNTVLSPDLLPPGTYAFLQNVRRYLQGRTVARAPLGTNLLPSTIASGPTSLLRLNDSTPTGPMSGFALIEGANGSMYLNSTLIASGLTGLPLTFVTFRPNASPPPWAYTADNTAGGVTLHTINLMTGSPTTFVSNGMNKVRSDGVIWHTGIAEPQSAPSVTFVGGGSGVALIFYRYVYRSSATGALSNPSPESIAGTNAQFGPSETVPATDFATKITFNALQYEFVGTQLRTKGGVSPGTVTDYVIAHNFGFSIPDGTNVASVTGSGGTGMTPGTYALVFTGGGGTGAAGTITVLTATTFSDPVITNGGTGYTSPPAVTAATGGTPPTLLSVLSTPVNVDGIQIDLNWVGQNAGTGVLSGVSLYYLGSPLGTTKFPGIQNQSFPTDTIQGGNSDTWGGTLTPSIVNDASFGFGVQITTQLVGGTDRSFLDSFTMTIYYSTQDADITPAPSADPQVDKIDFYRMGGSLAEFTYVGTGPNSATIFNDTLNDLAAVANQLLEFDNFEPFPSIDEPQAGVVNVTAGAVAGTMDVAWVSGDTFNIRWLPGTVIIIGTVAYTFYNRPSDTTHLTVILENIPFPSPSTNLVYEIQEPTLAAQPSPAIWGPTPDNAGSFYFGLDPLNTGQIVWSKGNNFDSAPDTNRLNVTSGSETLMNGVVTSELSAVFSTERFWLIIPNFADAVALTTGVDGSQWNLLQSAATRGLYMRFAIDALGSLIAWRAKDCICISMGGGPEQSITDAIYNLFPHEGFAPTAVTIGGNTVFPPDDTKPNAQTITVAPGYVFYNYQDTTGTVRTLCYDIEGKGWSVDVYTPGVNCHVWAVGQVDQLLVGCVDGSVRALQSGGAETGTAIITTRSENGGDDRAFKRIGDVFVKAVANASKPIAVGLWRSRITIALSGFAPTSLTGTGSLLPYVVDFTAGFGDDLDDIAAVFSWAIGSNNILDLWQPDWVPLPENTQDRPTDWGDAGAASNKLYRGLLMEMDTLGQAKTFSVERAEDGAQFTPNESPVTVSLQTLKAFTFTPPFVSHSVRTVSTDGVPWRVWGQQWITDPWVEYATLDSAWTNLGFQGAKYIRGLVLPMDTKGLSAQFKVVTSDGGSVTFTATTPSAVKTVVSFAFTPPIIAHDVQIQCLTATAGMFVEEARWDFDQYPEIIPEYTPIMEVNGPDNKFVQGVKLIADTANQSVTFQVLYDGGQTGPTFTGTFNGKQTKVFSWVPFLAHDIQLVPQANARIWWGGIGDGVSEWVDQPFPESTSNWTTELSANGGVGWQHLRYLNIEYLSTTPITITFTVDTGNGSITPQTIIIPSSNGAQTKFFTQVSYNKWKLLSMSATSSASFNLFAEGCEIWVKSWGKDQAYRRATPFGGPSSPEATV